MTPLEMEEAAELLHYAALNHQPVTPLRHRWPDMTQEQAYAIAQINTARYIAAGARRTGCKVGLTSRAVQQQLGVDQPDFGILFNHMEFGDNEVIPASALLQPKAEAEIAFVLGKDLNLGHIVLKDVLSAIEYALPAIEVVGSRIENWDIRITDTIADNASSGCYVLGTTPRKLTDIDLRLCGMVMSRCGNPVSTGAGVACLGTR
ncbi:2-keto-4-pentenoate hydratase [Mangrovibacter sp. SLW1]